MTEEQATNRPGGKKKGLSISTIISIALVLLMVGLLGMIVSMGKNLSNYVKENMYLSVIFKNTAPEKEILDFKKEIDKMKGVKSSEYISKEKAAESLEKELGEDFMSFLGYNPLPASMDVHLEASYAQNDSIAQLEKQLMAEDAVKEVNYQESLIESVNANIRTVSLVLLGFCTVLAIVAIALINNTIRLAIYSQRFLIKSMQLVGATKGFIKKPFLWLGILHGLLGALIAGILLILIIKFAEKQLPALKAVQNYQEYGLVLALMLVCGIIIAVLSTYFAMNKYLRKRVTDLYY